MRERVGNVHVYIFTARFLDEYTRLVYYSCRGGGTALGYSLCKSGGTQIYHCAGFRHGKKYMGLYDSQDNFSFHCHSLL